MKYLLLSTLFFTAAASAQQPSAVTYAAATIDGVTTPNVVVTIKGKSYIAVDALRARGLTLLKTDSFGLYRFPNAQGQPVKLTGCMNEWLTDGTTRVRVNTVRPYEFYEQWIIDIEFLTSKDVEGIREIFPPGQERVTMQDGQVLDPVRDEFVKINMDNYTAGKGKSQVAQLTFTLPDWSPGNVPTQLILSPASIRQTKGAWTFDLTCKK